METEKEHLLETPTYCQPVVDIHDIVNDLKHELATIVIEMRAMFQKQAIQKLMPTSITWAQTWTSVGLLSSIRLRVITLKDEFVFDWTDKGGDVTMVSD